MKIKSLLISIKHFVEKKNSASQPNPATNNTNTNGTQLPKTGFSNILGQRILEKKTSFNLTLRRGQSFTSDQKSNPDISVKENNNVEIKVINFGELPELKEMLNRFHHKEDDNLNSKHVFLNLIKHSSFLRKKH